MVLPCWDICQLKKIPPGVGVHFQAEQLQSYSPMYFSGFTAVGITLLIL
jgi:hypothetical protein